MDKVNFDNLMFDLDQMNIQIHLFHYQILLYNEHLYRQQLICQIQAMQHYLVHEMHYFHHHIDLMNEPILILDEMNHFYNEFQNDLVSQINHKRFNKNDFFLTTTSTTKCRCKMNSIGINWSPC
jgi:hypothetical protein